MRNEEENSALRIPNSALVKTLRAGDAFLSQSSKWIHFGLGSATEIEKLVVQWPGGQREEFDGLKVDHRYHIIQGSASPKPADVPQRTVALHEAPLDLSPSTRPARVVSASPPPVPHIQYRTFAGQERDVLVGEGQPILVNLWASWCMPCLQELEELSRRTDELRAAKLKVLALSVDALSNFPAADTGAAEKWATDHGMPFEIGMATEELIDILQIVHNEMLEDHRPLAVPTSFLIDKQGRLAVFYKGRVVADQLLADVAELQLFGPKRRNVSTPFPGRWVGGQEQYRLLDIAGQLIEEDYLDAAQDYLYANRRQLSEVPRYTDTLVRVGVRLLEQGRQDLAIKQFRRALEVRSDHVPAHYELGVIAEQTGRAREAMAHYRTVLDKDPKYGEAIFRLAVMLHRSGKVDEAIAHFRKWVELNPDEGLPYFNLAFALQQQNPDEALGHYRRAVALDPGLTEAQVGLTSALLTAGKRDEALAHLREWVRIRPKDVTANFNLALLLERDGSLDEAELQYKQTIELDPNFPEPYRQLAAVCTRRGDPAGAVAHYRTILQIRPDDVGALNDLALLLATHTDPAIRDGAQAVELARRAVEATGHQQPAVLDTLAAAYAEVGDFDKAVETADAAIELARKSRQEELAKQIEARLWLYEAGQVYRNGSTGE